MSVQYVGLVIGLHNLAELRPGTTVEAVRVEVEECLRARFGPQRFLDDVDVVVDESAGEPDNR